MFSSISYWRWSTLKKVYADTHITATQSPRLCEIKSFVMISKKLSIFLFTGAQI